jgi:hypothetical protein
MHNHESHHNKTIKDTACEQSELTSLSHAASLISSSKGTPSSNTVPSQYNSDPHVLRFGIDSLYLSYKGELSEDGENRLTELKELAQSEDARKRDKAQLLISDHIFEVSDKGQKPFAFVLEDNWFRIAISKRSSKSMPLAYVKVSSKLLTFSPIEEILNDLKFILNTLAYKVTGVKVSRIDLFADFTTQHDIDAIDINHWVTRSTLFSKYYIRPHFSGWSIGYKGDISARIYDKTLEIKTSKKDYLIPIWKESGWNEEQKVWRLEFQYKREILKELQLSSIDELIPNQGPLWRFASGDWLRLCLPNDKDTNSSRWPLHPLWSSLSEINWKDNPEKSLQRVRKERIPSDESLYINGIAGLTSFMALYAITDLYDGFTKYIVEAKEFHDIRGQFNDEDFESYIHKKVSEKGRHYNTISNQLKKDQATQKKEANDYKSAKDGE